MRNVLKWFTVLAAAAAAFISAGQSVPGGANEQAMRRETRTAEGCYTPSEVRFLKEQNGWSEETAREVLRLSCAEAVY